MQEERERRLAEVAMLERHIMQAQARAMSADERALNRVASAHSQFPDLGLPPCKSQLALCILEIEVISFCLRISKQMKSLSVLFRATFTNDY